MGVSNCVTPTIVIEFCEQCQKLLYTEWCISPWWRQSRDRLPNRTLRKRKRRTCLCIVGCEKGKLQTALQQARQKRNLLFSLTIVIWSRALALQSIRNSSTEFPFPLSSDSCASAFRAAERDPANSENLFYTAWRQNVRRNVWFRRGRRSCLSWLRYITIICSCMRWNCFNIRAVCGACWDLISPMCRRDVEQPPQFSLAPIKPEASSSCW